MEESFEFCRRGFVADGVFAFRVSVAPSETLYRSRSRSCSVDFR